VAVCRIVAHGLQERRSSIAAMNFWVVVYPAPGLAFHKICSMAKVMSAGDTNVRALSVPFFPFDQDVISLHRPSALREVLVDGDLSILYETSRVCAPSVPRRAMHIGCISQQLQAPVCATA
jgi:hypothetical protein